jgi:hypothetical protein
MHALPLAFAILMGSNCIENKVHNDKVEDTGGNAPLLVLWPDAVDFGLHRQGEGDTVTIEIRNEGTAPLTLSSVALEGDEGFTMLASELDKTLDPLQTTTVEVSFKAATLEHEARLVVLSDDPGASRAVVPIDGGGLLPALWVSPDPWDAGRVSPECTVEDFLTLANVGTDTLVIESVAQLGANFELDELELPLTIEPDEAYEAPIGFTPSAIGSFEGEIWIESNAPQHVAVQSGEGAEGGINIDEWKQPISGKADIMFYVDQSCSMEDDRERMVQNFGSFIDEMESSEVDYLVMVVTNDMGCHNMAYIKPETENKTTIFQQAVSGTGGMFTEAGFVIANNAMNQTGIGECNSEFYRDNSTVNVVFVSDEPEQSPYALGGSTGMLLSLLSKAPATFVNAVVGPTPGGGDCAEAGWGYFEAAVQTGGMNLDICDLDWGSHLVDLAEQASIAKLASIFYLSQGGVEPNSIVVEVDGEQVTEGWTFIVVENDSGQETHRYIEFDEASIPGEGTELKVTYSNAVTCEQ